MTNPDDLMTRADSLSAGARVYTHGGEAAALFRQAATLYRERAVTTGNTVDAYRATVAEELANWAEGEARS